MTTDLVELSQEAKIGSFIMALSQGQSITDACAAVGISRETAYAWMRAGMFDDLLSMARQQIGLHVMAVFEDVLPRLLQRIANDALNEDGEISTRDRDTAARTLLMFYKELRGDVPDMATGETAQEWLKKRRFEPFQVVLQQNVSVGESEHTCLPAQYREAPPDGEK